MRPVMRRNPVYQLLARSAVVLLTALFAAGASWAQPARDVACGACVRDVAGNIVSCTKHDATSEPAAAPSAPDSAAHGCCKKPQAAPPPEPKPASEHTGHPKSDGCGGKCERCCEPAARAPIGVASAAPLLAAAGPTAQLELTSPDAPPSGARVSIFHPPRA